MLPMGVYGAAAFTVERAGERRDHQGLTLWIAFRVGRARDPGPGPRERDTGVLEPGAGPEIRRPRP
jgi:hypothetical protein